MHGSTTYIYGRAKWLWISWFQTNHETKVFPNNLSFPELFIGRCKIGRKLQYSTNQYFDVLYKHDHLIVDLLHIIIKTQVH